MYDFNAVCAKKTLKISDGALDLRGSNVDSEGTTTQQAKVPKDVEVDETRKPICVSTSRKHHHENRTKRNKEENTQTETLYLSVLVRVEKSTKRMQPQSGQSRSNVPRILLTPHSSQLAEKGPQRISRSSAGAACVRRLSSRSACEWQKS